MRIRLSNEHYKDSNHFCNGKTFQRIRTTDYQIYLRHLIVMFERIAVRFTYKELLKNIYHYTYVRQLKGKKNLDQHAINLN